MEEFRDILYKLIEAVEAASPHLWRIAYRQVYADVIGYALGAIAVAAIMVAVFFVWRRNDIEEQEKDDRKRQRHLEHYSYEYETGYSKGTNLAVLAVLEVMFFTPFVGFLSAVAGRLVNPEYYAILVLMKLLGVK